MSGVALREIQGVLEAKSSALATALLETARLVPRMRVEIDASPEAAAEFSRRENVSLIAYISGWIAEDDNKFKSLYLGERAKMAYAPGHDAQTRNDSIRQLVENDRDVVLRTLASASEGARARLAGAFDALIATLSLPVRKELRVLFVGDCLYLDMTAFLTGRMLEMGLGLAPQFLTDRNPVKLAAGVKALRDEKFDAIFYSPFTYEFSNGYAEILRVRNAFKGEVWRKALADQLFDGVSHVAKVLASTFAAPIFIHNSAVIIRDETVGAKALKHALTSPMRGRMRKDIDARVDDLIADLNQSTFPHVHKFDETAIRARYSDNELGRYFHNFGLQHPARLGAELAGDYDLILETIGKLQGKKLIVCDLDNTLWDGVIGEGAVDHFADRQANLASLKKKGVLLAIASKNDPKNVHFTGGVLGEEDFVYSHIAWTPKAAAFSVLQKALNLKTKDFIFIDDRADERALAEAAHPEVLTFDPTLERTWRAFAMWEKLLGDEPDMDRTQMYHDRAKREAFTAEQGTAALDETAMFAALGLKIRIWEAEKKDVARATELINRTNQFNMQGSRTTFAQMSEWRESRTHRIYLASMADRFGDMGVISVLVADLSGDAVEIPIFVLSCRVFGYGAERAILNAVKKTLDETGKTAVVGRYVETMANAPCKTVYAENGFEERGGMWTYAKGAAPVEHPAWLTVEYSGS